MDAAVLPAGPLMADVAGALAEAADGAQRCDAAEIGLQLRTVGPGPASSTHDIELSALSLCCVAEGAAELVVGQRRWVCHAGSGLTLVRSGGRTGVLRPTSPRCLSMVLPMDPATVGDLWRELGLPDTGHADPGQDTVEQTSSAALSGELSEVLVRLLRTAATPGDNDVLASGFSLELTYRLLWSECGSWLVRAALQERASDPVSAADRFVRENLARPISVTDVADAAGLEVRELRRVFTRDIGMSPAQHLRKVRLDHARTLLLEDRYTVGEVAAAVGYLSNSHFISGFRERFGTSPRVYQAHWLSTAR
jgi:AraC-like DNA-binding protein